MLKPKRTLTKLCPNCEAMVVIQEYRKADSELNTQKALCPQCNSVLMKEDIVGYFVTGLKPLGPQDWVVDKKAKG